MEYPSHVTPRWKAFDDEGFLRWVAEYPVTKLNSVGPVSADDTIVCCELNQQLPDGTWRSTVVPYYWIQAGGIATFHVYRCGLVHVKPRHVLAWRDRDRRDTASTMKQVIECPCCNNLYYRIPDKVPDAVDALPEPYRDEYFNA